VPSRFVAAADPVISGPDIDGDGRRSLAGLMATLFVLLGSSSLARLHEP
jgi:hypothetical protein